MEEPRIVVLGSADVGPAAVTARLPVPGEKAGRRRPHHGARSLPPDLVAAVDVLVVNRVEARATAAAVADPAGSTVDALSGSSTDGRTGGGVHPRRGRCR